MTNPPRPVARRVRCDPGQPRVTRSRAEDGAHGSPVNARSGLPARRNGKSLRSCTADGQWSLMVRAPLSELSQVLRVASRVELGSEKHGPENTHDATGREIAVALRAVQATAADALMLTGASVRCGTNFLGLRERDAHGVVPFPAVGRRVGHTVPRRRRRPPVVRGDWAFRTGRMCTTPAARGTSHA